MFKLDIMVTIMYVAFQDVVLERKGAKGFDGQWRHCIRGYFSNVYFSMFVNGTPKRMVLLLTRITAAGSCSSLICAN